MKFNWKKTAPKCQKSLNRSNIHCIKCLSSPCPKTKRKIGKLENQVKHGNFYQYSETGCSGRGGISCLARQYHILLKLSEFKNNITKPFFSLVSLMFVHLPSTLQLSYRSVRWQWKLQSIWTLHSQLQGTDKAPCFI